MREGFDPQRLYNTLPYGSTVPSQCLGVTRLEFVCEGEGEQLDRCLWDTPFALADDRFVVGFSDRRNARTPLFDASVTLAIRFRDRVGGHPLIVLEDAQRMVYGGREKWGYPKLHAEMDMQITDGRVTATARLGGRDVLDLAWEEDASAEAQAVAKPVVSPHFLARILPSADREGIDFCDIVTRDVGKDFRLKRKRYGKGRIRFGDAPEGEIRVGYAGLAHGFAGITVKRVVSASCVEGDWFSTEENGWGKSIERFK